MDNNEIFLSICIPTYNRGHKLRSTIESVIKQKYQNYELIICDNSSTDNTKQVVDSFDDNRIKYFFYDALVDMYANHNRCIDRASGEWIVFLHSDDLLIDVENVIKIKETFSASISCYFPSLIAKDKYTYSEVLSFFNGYSPSGSIYRRDDLIEIGYFQETNIIADWEILLDFTYAGKEIASYNREEINFIHRINDGENAYLKSIKDGSAHRGKTECIQRQFSRLVRQDGTEKLFEEALSLWTTHQIMQLFFYLNLGGYISEANRLAKWADKEGKYSWLHSKYFLGLLARYLKIEYFLFLYTKARLIL